MRPAKFTIVTPCLDAEGLIGETIRSVLEQTAVRSGRVALQYLVRDGASRDRTIEVARSFASPALSIVSKKDSGMYEALAQGLRAAEGDWIAYLNAGDVYSPTAFDVILDVLETHDVKWITGFATESNEPGQLVSFSLPFKYRRSFIRAGQYSRRPPLFLPWIQQESTFWHASLNATIDWDRLSNLRLAGDAYLWTRFARECELTIVAAHLGGFRRHAGQLSENAAGYLRELASFAESAPILGLPIGFYDNLMWFAPPAMKKALNPRGMIVFDRRARCWG